MQQRVDQERDDEIGNRFKGAGLVVIFVCGQFQDIPKSGFWWKADIDLSMLSVLSMSELVDDSARHEETSLSPVRNSGKMGFRRSVCRRCHLSLHHR